MMIMTFDCFNKYCKNFNNVLNIWVSNPYMKVVGFIKEKEDKNIIPIIPFVLKQLIFRYFQLFSTLNTERVNVTTIKHRIRICKECI